MRQYVRNLKVAKKCDFCNTTIQIIHTYNNDRGLCSNCGKAIQDLASFGFTDKAIGTIMRAVIREKLEWPLRQAPSDTSINTTL